MDTLRKRKIQMPEGWQPNSRHRAMAFGRGLDVDDQADRFTDYHEAHGNVFASWDAAFRTWLRRAAEYAEADKGKSRIFDVEL